VVLLFRPFTSDMWLCSLLAALFVSLVFFVTEHGHAPRFMRLVAASGADGVHNSHVLSHHPVRPLTTTGAGEDNGYFTKAAFRHDLPDAVVPTFASLFGGEAPKALTLKGSLLRLAWAFFTLIFVAAYTANLAAMLADDGYSLSSTTLDDLRGRPSTIKVCAREGTEYLRWLRVNYDGTNLDFDDVDAGDVWEKLRKQKCDVYADNAAFAQLMASDKEYCGRLYSKRDSALKWGLLDFAFGSLDPKVADALSYWITELRQCSQKVRGSGCTSGRTSRTSTRTTSWTNAPPTTSPPKKSPRSSSCSPSASSSSSASPASSCTSALAPGGASTASSTSRPRRGSHSTASPEADAFRDRSAPLCGSGRGLPPATEEKKARHRAKRNSRP